MMVPRWLTLVRKRADPASCGENGWTHSATCICSEIHFQENAFNLSLVLENDRSFFALRLGCTAVFSRPTPPRLACGESDEKIRLKKERLVPRHRASYRLGRFLVSLCIMCVYTECEAS
jgi:hypothetical protein